MRIIKQGIIQKVQHYQTTCDNCKTEFEFSEDDGAWVCGSNTDSVLSLGCPFCRKSVSVKIQCNEVCNEAIPTTTR